MAIPTYDKFIEPLLRLLAESPGAVRASEAHEVAAARLGVGSEDRRVLLPSGTQPVYKNRCGWAHDRLKRAGLSSSPRRGLWQLTEEGRRYAAANPEPLSDTEIERLAVNFMDVRLRPSEGVVTIPGTALALASSDIATSDPEERLESALGEMRRSVAAEVLEALARCCWTP